MSNSEIRKACDSCGVTLTPLNRHENAGGTSLCGACYSERQKDAPALTRKRSLRRCTSCGQMVARKDCHKKSSGDYICLECYEKRQRRASRRRFLRFAKLLFRYALIAGIGALAAAGFLWLSLFSLGRLAEPPPEE